MNQYELIFLNILRNNLIKLIKPIKLKIDNLIYLINLILKTLKVARTSTLHYYSNMTTLVGWNSNLTQSTWHGTQGTCFGPYGGKNRHATRKFDM